MLYRVIIGELNKTFILRDVCLSENTIEILSFYLVADKSHRFNSKLESADHYVPYKSTQNERACAHPHISIYLVSPIICCD